MCVKKIQKYATFVGGWISFELVMTFRSGSVGNFKTTHSKMYNIDILDFEVGSYNVPRALMPIVFGS